MVAPSRSLSFPPKSMTETAAPTVVYRPYPGPQTRFQELSCFEVLYGGAAGGGKSAGGVVAALRHIGRGFGPAYKALILRREYTEIEQSILPETEKYYPALGGRYLQQKHRWVFPGGERVQLGHAQHLEDIKKLLGTEYQYVYLDEVTTFEKSQYTYVISRLRSTHPGIRRRLRSGTNPGSRGHAWVFERFGAWLDPDAPVKAESGQVLYFCRREDETEYVVPKGTPKSLGRCFIAATTKDNPAIDDVEGYLRQLDELDAVTRAQLKSGNWLIKPARGLYYKRAWFGELLDEAPDDCSWVRWWDRAATEEQKGKDPDWTVGLKLARVRTGALTGKYVIGGVVRMRGSPGEVARTIKMTADMDGRGTMIAMPEDPGAAGKFESDAYSKLLTGFNVRFFRETGDKVTRQNPVSAQAERGNVRLVRGPWNEPFLQVLEAFPEGGHDDDVDALGGAFNAHQTHREYVPPKAAAPSSIVNRFAGF